MEAVLGSAAALRAVVPSLGPDRRVVLPVHSLQDAAVPPGPAEAW